MYMTDCEIMYLKFVFQSLHFAITMVISLLHCYNRRAQFISDLKGRKLPIDGPWRHFSIKHFIKNVQEGKETTGKLTTLL